MSNRTATSLFEERMAARLTKILEKPSANVSDSLVQAMDRVANRVAHDLKKK